MPHIYRGEIQEQREQREIFRLARQLGRDPNAVRRIGGILLDILDIQLNPHTAITRTSIAQYEHPHVFRGEVIVQSDVHRNDTSIEDAGLIRFMPCIGIRSTLVTVALPVAEIHQGMVYLMRQEYDGPCSLDPRQEVFSYTDGLVLGIKVGEEEPIELAPILNNLHLDLHRFTSARDILQKSLAETLREVEAHPQLLDFKVSCYPL